MGVRRRVLPSQRRAAWLHGRAHGIDKFLGSALVPMGIVRQRPGLELRQIKTRPCRFGTVVCMSNIADETVPLLTEAMRRRLDRPGPRHTSYPTADRFGDTFGPDDYARALARRASGATVGGRPPLSIYVHIPFCESVCYGCACNKIITRHHGRAADYLDVLAQEVALNVALLGSGQAVSQLHLGGGTPTFLSMMNSAG